MKQKSDRLFSSCSPDDLLEYTGSADLGSSLIQNTCKSYFYCMPNKLFEYLMTGLPVLVSDMKEMKEFVEKKKSDLQWIWSWLD